MKLVLVDDRNRVVKIYEQNCTEDQIDTVFNEYLQLREHVRLSLSKPQQVLPSMTLVGADLTAWMQANMQAWFNEYEHRQALKKRAESWTTRPSIWWNKIKAGALAIIIRIFSRSKKAQK